MHLHSNGNGKKGRKRKQKEKKTSILNASLFCLDWCSMCCLPSGRMATTSSLWHIAYKYTSEWIATGLRKNKGTCRWRRRWWRWKNEIFFSVQNGKTEKKLVPKTNTQIFTFCFHIWRTECNRWASRYGPFSFVCAERKRCIRAQSGSGTTKMRRTAKWLVHCFS